MRTIVLLFFLVILSACGTTVIRIENQSGEDFEDVGLNYGAGDLSYGALADGERSPYKEYPNAFSYGRVFGTIDGQQYDSCSVPIDYVGENPIEDGEYTIPITVDPVRQCVVAGELIRD